GLIPTGWYPGAVLVSADGQTLYVANVKGHGSLSQPRPAAKGKNSHDHLGSVSIIPVPDAAQLAEYTRQVNANNRLAYSLAGLERPRDGAQPVPVPRRHGEPSVFKHVIYVIKENRTYDQVVGDVKEGNGDPSLCLFGQEATPNQHALAREFVLLDNFYVDAEVSADGHNWSMAAYATDYTEKTWPTNYSNRGRTYDYEGSKKIARPTGGYIWDYCARAGVTYRSYGEFVASREGKPGGGGETGGDPG